jgi:arylsulfatase A-like enzyme
LAAPRLRLVLTILLLGAGEFACSGHRFSPPDILIVSVDTLRADHVGAYGHAAARTPNIDALAREGTLFRQATTPFPRTTPGLASLLTGLWAHHHGSREVGRSIDNVPTLALVLAANGYEARGISANGSAGRSQGLDRGFAPFIDPSDFNSWRAENTTKRALTLLSGANREKPLLFWVHYVDPHYPYEPPKGFKDQPPAEQCHKLLAMQLHREISLTEVRRDWHRVASRALADCQGLYDAEIAYVDAQIGQLLAAWRKARGRGSVVVFTSDHGENFGEDGLFFEHGPNVYDAAMRVPLIVAGAGPRGRVDEGVARLEDVMPTLLSLAQLPRERWPAVDGVDLSARLAGASAEREEVAAAFVESGSEMLVDSYHRLRSGSSFKEHCVNLERFSLCEGGGRPEALYDHAADPGREHDVSARHPEELKRLRAVAERWPYDETRQRAIRTSRFKLIEVPAEAGYETRLYDLAADPGETRNVITDHQALAARLRSALDTWAAGTPGKGTKLHTPEQIETLRALGYVE